MYSSRYSVRRMRERTGEHDLVSALAIVVVLLVLLDIVLSRL